MYTKLGYTIIDENAVILDSRTVINAPALSLFKTQIETVSVFKFKYLDKYFNMIPVMILH